MGPMTYTEWFNELENICNSCLNDQVTHLNPSDYRGYYDNEFTPLEVYELLFY